MGIRENGNNAGNIITVVVKSAANLYELPTETLAMGDLAVYFKRKDLTAPAFTASVSRALLAPGNINSANYDPGKRHPKNNGISYDTYQYPSLPR